MNYRVYVKKKPGFEVESKSMLKNLNTNLELNLTGLRIINTYDLYGFSESLLKKELYYDFVEKFLLKGGIIEYFCYNLLFLLHFCLTNVIFKLIG